MNMKLWSVCVALVSTSLMAQEMTNPPPTTTVTEPPAVAPAMAPATPALTNAPAVKASRKKAAAKKSAKKAPLSETRTVPLVPGPAVVAANHVNVRGQAKLNSEVIGRMGHGEAVTVIEEVKLKNSGPEEPSVWAKIVLPEKAHAWVNAAYIDATNKTVLPKKLNLRGGPGENFSVLGTLTQGEPVKEVSVKGKWMQIETTNGYAFMAAQYLTQEPAELAAVAPVEPATVTETPAVAEAPTNAPAMTELNADTNVVAATPAPVQTPAVEEPPSPRIVQREGVVRYTGSIQAPTIF